MREFDLNIQQVLENWTLAHAVREVIANALDEQALTGSRDPEIAWDDAGALHVRDWGRGLRYEHLTQNEDSEKLANPDVVIGKFGVGLKDAMATFHRQGVDVSIRSRHGDVSIATRAKHGFEDVVTLHAMISDPLDASLEGTDFILRGSALTEEVVEEAKGYFLKYSNERVVGSSKYGLVLSGTARVPARIYVNGLLVAREDNFLFSYNITSTTKDLRKALNRERTNVGRSAYSDRVKAILLNCDDAPVIEKVVRDLERFVTGRQHDETLWLDVGLHACQLLNARESVVFVTSFEAMAAPELLRRAKEDGRRVVVVPDTIRAKLPRMTDVEGNPMQDLDQFHLEWNEGFTFAFVSEQEMSPQERTIWGLRQAIANVAGGIPKAVNEVLVSETMRLNASTYTEQVGIWEPITRRVIIRRSELETIPRFAGVLIHEFAHASSGAGDSTREFESELTELLGLLASKLVS